MSSQSKSNQLVLAERPQRGPVTDKTFRRETSTLPQLQNGEVRVRVDYVSIDPTQRNWLNDARSYMEPVKIGAVMRAAGVGRVVQSRADGFAEGDLVYGTLGWQTYWQGPANKVEHRSIPRGGKDIDHLGLFGASGMTAYFGMFDIGRLKDGDNVVISGAAGSVGLIATQIALAHPKCTVTGIAGSPEKCAELKKLGVHHAINYKDKDFRKQLKKVGLVDLYFDNVGGEILDMVLAQLQVYARVVLCGMIAAYNATAPPPILNLPALISTKSSMTGFIVFDYAKRYGEARAYLADMVDRGKIKYDYHVLGPKKGEEDGLGRCVGALEDVFTGRNFGKTVVRVSPEEKSKL